MSSLHLAKGASQPPKVDGKLRLYSMNFCPFAQRARLVLIAKGVPHDIVNVNLKDKPDWLFTLNPQGLVPILDTGSKVVTESLDVCDYLDKEYPNPPLYSTDDAQNQKDKELVESFGSKVIPKYYEACLKKDPTKSLDEYMSEILPLLEKYENELKERGTFFGGDQPKMIDYMIWPWAERAGVLEKVFNEKFKVDEKTLPRIFKWCEEMRKTEPVVQTIASVERAYKLAMLYKAGGTVDYDSI